MRAVLAVLAIALAGPCLAQRTGTFAFNGIGSGGQDLRGERFAQGGIQERYVPRDSRSCKHIGCLVLVNQSRELVVTEFYVNDGEHDRSGALTWRENQLLGTNVSAGMGPHQATWWFRPTGMKCSTSVRAVMRDDKGAHFELTGDVNLCVPGQPFAVVTVDDTVKGKVEVLPVIKAANVPTVAPAKP
jgi:hypothetical protein